MAVITWEKLPRHLDDGGNNWPLTVTVTNPADSLSICFSIIIDSYFDGFTPLNAIKDSAGHTIE